MVERLYRVQCDGCGVSLTIAAPDSKTARVLVERHYQWQQHGRGRSAFDECEACREARRRAAA